MRDSTLLAVSAALALAALLLAVALGVAWRRSVARGLLERRALEEGLRASHARVDALAEEVQGLSTRVETTRRAAEDERGFVITTLAEATVASGVGGADLDEPGPRAAQVDLETRLVEGLARLEPSALGRRVVEAGVATIAAAHGVRRALRPEHLDRASAEAHVARRRSRRLRRQELREAKRLIRAVKAQHADQRPDQRPETFGREVA